MDIPRSVDQPFSIPDALQQAHAHWNAGQADQAEILCQRVLAAWPGQTDASHLLGLIAYAFGNLDIAINHLRQACRAPRAPAVYFSNLAEMLRQRGLLIEGEQSARQALAMDNTLMGAWNNLGIILQQAGKYEESLSCLKRVLFLDPENAEACNNLGNTCKLVGLLDQAEEYWEKAIKLRPNYAEAYSNLANVFNEQSLWDKSAEYARRAIDLNPQLVDAYINLAAVESSRQRHGEALHWLNALLTFASSHSSGLAARALVLKQMDRIEEALDSAQSSVAAGPDNAEAHNILGLVLQRMGRVEEALAAYERAAALPGTVAEKALINRAIQLMELGRATDAEMAFGRVLETFPRSASAFFNGADLKKFTRGDPNIQKMQDLLSAGGAQSNRDQMLLQFSLGKAFLDIGDSDLAFQHLNEGNKMKRKSIVYDAEATSGWIEQISATFTPALLERLGDKGPTSSMPIFIVGMPRSGSTLVEQILASHPAIHGAGELTYLQQSIDHIGNFPVFVEDITSEKLKGIGEAYLSRMTRLAVGRPHVVDKMPANFLYAGLIRVILPNARIIHCRRNAVDTCLSCYSKLFEDEQRFSYDQNELGRFYLDYQKLTMHWQNVLPASNFLVVDYEAVIDNVETETRRMLEFLELPWDPACLNFYSTERIIRTASVNQVRQPIYRSSSGRWRDHVSNLTRLLSSLQMDLPKMTNSH